jgi:AbiV family abortive infection protein
LGLLVLALEELGRIPVLLNAVLISPHDQKMWSKFWVGLRQHTLKQGVWTAYGKKLADSGHPHAPYFTPALPANYERLLDKFKQCGFYVSCVDGTFLLPNMFARFDKEKIENLFGLVGDRIEGFKELHSRLTDSYRMVSQLRETIRTWSEERLRKEIESVFSEWPNRDKSTSRGIVQ